MNIKYEFLTGEIIEIEVPDCIGKVSIAIDKEVYNSDRRETRRHNYISNMEEKGIQFPDGSQDITLMFEQQVRNAADQSHRRGVLGPLARSSRATRRAI